MDSSLFLFEIGLAAPCSCRSASWTVGSVAKKGRKHL